MGLICKNRLLVTGDEAAVYLFMKENRSGPDLLDFAKSVPEPDYHTAQAGVRRPEWHNWHNKNWGTRENPRSTSIDQLNLTDGMIGALYLFSTQKSPPELWLQEVSKQYPLLNFCLSYKTNNQESGGLVFSKGELRSTERNIDY